MYARLHQSVASPGFLLIAFVYNSAASLKLCAAFPAPHHIQGSYTHRDTPQSQRRHYGPHSDNTEHKRHAQVNALLASALSFAASAFASSVMSCRLSFDSAGEGGCEVAGVLGWDARSLEPESLDILLIVIAFLEGRVRASGGCQIRCWQISSTRAASDRLDATLMSVRVSRVASLED